MKNRVQNASFLLKRDAPVAVVRHEAESRPAGERLGDWSEIAVKPALAMIQTQASRCLDCGLPGCSNACPLHNRIPEWLEQVAAGNFQGAAEIAHSTSNLPEICGTLCPQHRLCEGACTKAKEPGGAVTIGAIERFLTNEALDNNWPLATVKNTKHKDKHIAIIGAGPAGLACADELNKAGCQVTVFDRHEKIGGLLATGVPPFKLDKAMLERRHHLLQQQGVNFQLGIEVDETLLQKLLSSHHAIFLGTGSPASRDPQVPGQELDGVTDALSYLQQVNDGNSQRSMFGKRVLVIGGGDSAMDCARSALRQGAAGVSIACRSNEKAMRASPKEKKAAQEEGVLLRLEYAPTKVLGDEKVTGVSFNKPGGQEIIACDAVIFAVGQVNKPAAWMTRLGIATDQQGNIIVDADGRTTNPKIYAGGDNASGPALVVTAIAAGRHAAEGILKSIHLGHGTWQRHSLPFKGMARVGMGYKPRTETHPHPNLPLEGEGVDTARAA